MSHDGTGRPIFVTGPGRSGSTLLVEMLSMHPDVAWFSGLSDRWPTHPSVAALSRVQDVEAIRLRTIGRRRWPRAAEALRLWDHYFPGFRRNDRDLGAADVVPDQAERFHAVVAAHRRWQGKPRFLTKYTGFPRIEFVRTVFPDARMVYIDRDPRAVVMSHVRRRWGYKHNPEGWAALTPAERIDKALDRYLRQHTALVAAGPPGDSYHLVDYARLVHDPDGTLAEVLAAVDLPDTDRFRRRLTHIEVTPNGLDAWRDDVDDEGLAQLELGLDAAGVPFG